MAGYGYTNRGYTNYNGIGPRPDEWSKTSYGGNGQSDHVCRPVVIDAEGRKQPIVYYPPNHSTESYVEKTETIIERVHMPVVTEYKYSAAKVESPKEYGVVNNKWGSPPRLVYDRPPKVEEFITKIQTEVSQPTKTSPLSSVLWRQTPNSSSVYGEYSDLSNKEWNKPSGDTYWSNKERNRPSVDTNWNNKEWNRPSGDAYWSNKERSRPSGDAYWSNKEWNSPSGDNYWSSKERNKPSGDTNWSNKEWNKPSDDTNWSGNYRRDDPKSTTWPKPSHTGLSAPLNPEIPLTKPTNDIGAAIEVLKEAARTSPVTTAMEVLKEVNRTPAITTAATQPRVTGTVPRRDAYTGTIDNREAARKYGNFNASSRPKEDAYTTTIDSREAMKRYNGEQVG